MAVDEHLGVLGRRPNLTRDVTRHIRDQILSGRLRPGQKIDQGAIAEQLGVSRLPVRESLIALEAEGLVENVVRRGSFVPLLTPTDIRDHYEMYGLLSGLAARRAAQALDQGAIESLESLTAQMERTTDPREEDRFNYEFHRLINRAGHSRRLAAVLRTLSTSMPTHFFEYNSAAWERQAESEHRRIVQALRERDGEAAAEAIVSHFRHIGEQAVQMLASNGYWAEASTPSTATPEL